MGATADFHLADDFLREPEARGATAAMRRICPLATPGSGVSHSTCALFFTPISLGSRLPASRRFALHRIAVPHHRKEYRP